MTRKKAMEGKSAYAISKETGVAENTAKRYIDQPVRQHGLKGRIKGSKLDPYKPQIDAMLWQVIFNCVVMQERLQETGYKGGITILKDDVHPQPQKQGRAAESAHRGGNRVADLPAGTGGVQERHHRGNVQGNGAECGE